MSFAEFIFRPPRRDTLILCYHAVSESWDSPLAVTPGELRDNLRSLREHGYVAATLQQAMSVPPAERTVVLTFDDAVESVRTLAAPVLAEAGMSGTVFVPTALVDGPGAMSWPGVDHWLGTPHEHEMRGMGWAGVQELADAGWEIGSHTRTHPHLTRLGDDELRDELVTSRLELEERLGRPCPSFAYPYGDVDARVIEAAGEAGYRFAVTLPDTRDRWEQGATPLGWPRVGVYPGTTGRRFAMETSMLMRRVRAGTGLRVMIAAGGLRSRLRH